MLEHANYRRARERAVRIETILSMGIGCCALIAARESARCGLKQPVYNALGTGQIIAARESARCGLKPDDDRPRLDLGDRRARERAVRIETSMCQAIGPIHIIAARESARCGLKRFCLSVCRAE